MIAKDSQYGARSIEITVALVEGWSVVLTPDVAAISSTGALTLASLSMACMLSEISVTPTTQSNTSSWSYSETIKVVHFIQEVDIYYLYKFSGLYRYWII